MIGFEWDPEKARRNLRRHKVSFLEARFVFADPFAVTTSDPAHSEDESRSITIGYSASGRLLVVVHTERSGNYPHHQRANSDRVGTKSL